MPKILKENQIPFQTLYPAKLKVNFTDGKKTYLSAAEATEDMSRRGYAVKIIKQPETIRKQLKQLTWTRVTRDKGVIYLHSFLPYILNHLVNGSGKDKIY